MTQNKIVHPKNSALIYNECQWGNYYILFYFMILYNSSFWFSNLIG